MPSPAPPPTPIGSHLRVSGGLATSGIRHATRAGAEAVQVFVANPQGWATGAGNPGQDAQFREHMDGAGIPVFVHAPYLINFGSPTAETVRLSELSLTHSLRRAAEIGARGVVLHTGSAVTAGAARTALRQVRERLLPLLDAIPGSAPRVLLEPTAGQGQSLCSTIEEIPPYLDALEHHPSLGICLDTCHLFAAGHDLTDAGDSHDTINTGDTGDTSDTRDADGVDGVDGVTAVLDMFDRQVGRVRLDLVHANDSVEVCGSRRDRHARIGKGHLGTAPFTALVNHPVVRGVPVIVETPGTADEHGEDVAILKRLRQPQLSGREFRAMTRKMLPDNWGWATSVV